MKARETHPASMRARSFPGERRRTNDIESATSQFFVNLKDNDFLDNKPGSFGYAVFGRVTQGMDVVDKIAAVKTGRRKGYDEAPLEDVTIVAARRVDAE